MRTKNLWSILLPAFIMMQACTTDDVSITEDPGPEDDENIIVIPDKAFGEYLRYHSITGVYSSVSNEDGEVAITYLLDTVESKTYVGEINLNKSQTFITRLTEAGLATAVDKIKNLEGIQYFHGATSLVLTSNELTSLDVTNLTNLETLNMNNNWVSELDLTQNTKLVTLSYNASSSANAPEVSKLSSLDLSKNTLLQSLTMKNHELTFIDLSYNTALKDVDLSGNTGAPFNVPENIYNNLTTAVGVQPGTVTPPDQGDYYTVSDKALGMYLNYRLNGTDIIVAEGNTYKINKVKANQYTGELQLSKAATAISELKSNGFNEKEAEAKITNIDGLQFFTKATSLVLTSNEITSIDVSELVELETLTLNNNFVGSLDVSKNTKLKVLNYNASSKSTDAQKLTFINLTNNTELTTLSMKDHLMTSIDLSNNINLVTVNLSGNTGAPFTIPTEIYNNLVKPEGVEPGTIVVDYYTIPDLALGAYLNYRLSGSGIIVQDGNTYKIDKEKAAEYTGELSLSKAGTYITELKNAGFDNDEAQAKIKNADGLQFFTKATLLMLTSNEITSIDVSDMIELTSLTLNNNWIPELDVTKNVKLQTLNYNASTSSSAPENRKLTTIDLTKNTELTTISMTNHSLSTIDLSKNTKLTTANLTGNPGIPFKIPAEIYNNLSDKKNFEIE